jgi:hypothetical protein
MKRLLMVMVIWIGCAGVCLAQQQSGELQGFFGRWQPFHYKDPSLGIDMSGKAFTGGGFGMLLNVTEKFGIYQQTGFFGGVSDNGNSFSLITEFQGMQASKRKDRIDFFAKVGLGFARYVVNLPAFGVQQYPSYNFALQYGGGTEIKLKPGLYLLIEVTAITSRLPNLTGADGRSTWNTGIQIGPGISLHF